MILPSEKLKVFVYGSLRTGFFNYDKYLKGKVLSCKHGKVKGKLYDMPHKGYPAVISGDDDIYGEIMEVSNYEEVMNAVDKMEGYYGPNNENNEYNRIIVEVYNTDDNIIEKCYMYEYALNDKEKFDKHSLYLDHGCWKTFKLNK